MKKNYILILFLFIYHLSFSQAPGSENLIPYNNSEKWGFSDSLGNLEIECKYDYVTPFESNYARIVSNGKHGLINRKGKEVIKPEYDTGANVVNGMAYFKKDSLWFYLDTNLTVLFSKKVDGIGYFYGDYAIIIVKNKYGLINRKGETVLPTEYNDIATVGNTFRLKRDEYWGVLNHKLDTLLPFIYDSLSIDNEAAIFTKTGNRYALRDTNNQLLTKELFMDVGIFNEGLAAVKIDNKWGFINEKGKLKIKPKYSEVSRFSEGKAAVSINFKWGYIDKAGKELTPIHFAKAYSFNENRATVALIGPGSRELNIDGRKVNVYSSDYEFYLIDDSFAKIKMKTYPQIDYVNFGIAVFSQSHKQGLLDKEGKILVEAKYSEIQPLSNGLYIVTRDSGNIRKPYYGFMNRKGFEYFKKE
jgi:hypothetical protein